jgi:riboflavin kinase/FMN adenylyltransferase
LGIFDGLHLGHQYILKSMIKYAKAHRKKSVCITFFPHPSKILSSKRRYVHRVSLEHRLKLIEDIGVDVYIVIRLNRKFCYINPEDFVQILKEKLNPSVIFVGSNFTFGRGAKGNVKLLKKLAKTYGFKVKEISPLKLGGRVISSTLIRSLIVKGKLKLAQKYLGRPVSILGKVVRGKGIGRKLGYHTANVNSEHEVIPPSGVYAVRVKIKNRLLWGAAYIGRSPTMHLRLKLPRLEVYILNFYQNIYGEEIEVEFIQKIRNEEKFSSLLDLSSQIKKDILKVRSVLSALPSVDSSKN